MKTKEIFNDANNLLKSEYLWHPNHHQMVEFLRLARMYRNKCIYNQRNNIYDEHICTFSLLCTDENEVKSFTIYSKNTYSLYKWFILMLINNCCFCSYQNTKRILNTINNY